MSDHIHSLLKLQTLDFDQKNDPNAASIRTELRNGIPQPILAHYDRLVGRGKKGVAVVRNQVCTGCHMRLPIGTINTLMQRHDIQLCDTCGRYLYLAEPEPANADTAAPAASEAKAPKAPRKPRKRKALAQAAL